MTRLAVLGLVGILSVVWASSAIAAKPFTLTIQRNMTCSGDETIGSLSVGAKEIGRTLELPWRQDAANLSRVQAGSYAAKIRDDGKLGWRIELFGVPKHGQIELHIGNFATNTEGCVLLGLEVGKMVDPKTNLEKCSVKRSAEALEAVRAEMQSASDNGVSSQALDITVEIKD